MIAIGADVAVEAAGLGWGEGPRRAAALGHAVQLRCQGLWVDDPAGPSCLVWLRPGEGQVEAFAAGRPGPAAAWLARRDQAVTLLAPPDWGDAIRAEVGGDRVEGGSVVSWGYREHRPWLAAPPRGLIRPGHAAPPPTRRLGMGDQGAFAAGAPGWALRAWESFGELVEHGAAFAVPTASGDAFAALAWTVECGEVRDALGVWAAPAWRRLGLGRAAAAALISHVIAARRRLPLWATNPENASSLALARSLGLRRIAEEGLIRWPATAHAAR